MHDWNKPELQYSHIREKCILDGVSYDDWILMCYSNISDERLNEQVIKKELFQLFRNHMEEAVEIANNSAKYILEYVQEMRRENNGKSL